MEKLINDAVAMMARVGISEERARKKLEIAIFAVMLEEMQAVIQGPTINRSLPQVTLGGDGPTMLVPTTVDKSDPIAASATLAPAGKSWRGTGRAVVGANGDRVEIGTWINPAGDIEAARLTKETGIPHVVDPNTGDVVKVGGGAIEIAPPKLADPGTVVPDPLAMSGVADVRPEVGTKSWK